MAMKQGLYAQVVMLCRKDLKFNEENKNKNKAKFKFQGQSERSQRWFNVDFDWIRVNLCTREPEFCRKLFQRHDDTQDTNAFKIYQVPIGISKYVEKLSFTVMPQ